MKCKLKVYLDLELSADTPYSYLERKQTTNLPLMFGTCSLKLDYKRTASIEFSTLLIYKKGLLHYMKLL